MPDSDRSTDSSGGAAPGPTPRRARTSSWIDRLTSPSGLILSGALLILLVPVTSAIRDPDFWWHLRAGQIILASHQLIATDPFTYTVPAHVWTMHEWATEVSFAWLLAVGGLGLIVIVLAVISWVGLLLIASRAHLDRPHPVLLAIGMVVAALVGYPIWGPRVQMLTFALSALVLFAAERYLCGQSGQGRWIWLLVPLFAVWSNFHSGFIIGIGFLVIIAVADLLGSALRTSGSAPPRRALVLLAVAAACSIAAMLNPNGPGIVLYPFATQGSAAQQAVIQEWHSPDFHLWEVRYFYAPMLLTLALLIVLNRQIRLRDAALVAATVVLSLQSVRHIALFVVAATPVWINQADIAWHRWTAARLARRRAPIRRRVVVLPPLWMRATCLTVIVAVVAGAAGLRMGSAASVQADSTTYAEDLPVCAAQWLLTAPSGLRIFNQYGEGGYLAYALSAHGDHIFIFGDAALMGDDLLVQYGAIQNLAPDWDNQLTKYGTDLVVFNAAQPLPNVLSESPRWTRVYHDAHDDVFARTDRVAALHLPPQPIDPPTSPCGKLAAMTPDQLNQP